MNKQARKAALRYAEKMQEFGERMIEIAGNLEQQVENSTDLLTEINELAEDTEARNLLKEELNR